MVIFGFVGCINNSGSGGGFENIFQRLTSIIGISRVGWGTKASRIVIDNLALGIHSTSSLTRIFAFVIDASLVTRTIIIGLAFRMAKRGLANVTRQTFT